MSADFGDHRLPDRFWSKAVISDGGCWLWTAGRNNAGYGLFNTPGRVKKLSHRVAFEALASAIPEGLDIDHLCRVRHCCNPDHLEPVTRSENIIRGIGPTILGQRSSAKTHCPSGHELAGPNLYVCTRGKRNCRACRREQRRSYQARKRATEAT